MRTSVLSVLFGFLVGFLVGLPSVLGADTLAAVSVAVELPRRAQVGHQIYLALQGPEVYGTRQDPEYPLVLILNANDIARRQVEGIFPSVVQGRYVVSGFLDENKDNNLNIGIFGPTEPWDIFNLTRPHLGLPRFDRVALILPLEGQEAEPIILRLR